MFSRNPRGWGYKPLLDRDCDTYKGKVQATGIIPVDHMPYLPNLASPKPDIYEKSIAALTAELDRAGNWVSRILSLISGITLVTE